MKTMIIFSSTYGYTKECANKLSQQLNGEAFLVNLKTDTIPPMNEFDNIVIGGSIYMGQIQKKIKTFCISNVELLKNKKLGFFLCCGLPENFEQSLKNSFPQELLDRAIAKECFGGELRTQKMNLGHKILTGFMKKAAAKEGKEAIKEMPENIVKLAVIINEVNNLS